MLTSQPTQTWILRALVLAFNILPIAGWKALAHRGVYKDLNNAYALPDNSMEALMKGISTGGIYGVEVDIRLASDGTPMVFHDYCSNRACEIDGAGGTMNPVEVALKHQPAPACISIAGRTGVYWRGQQLKTYGHNAKIINSGKYHPMATLNDLAGELRARKAYDALVMLDIREAYTVDRAAAIIKDHGLTRAVHIKFYASSGISPEAAAYSGADSCYQYARAHGLMGVKIIPQINSNSLTVVKGVAYIKAFQRYLTVGMFLDCWANAQKDHGGNAALMAFVGASVPPNAKAVAQIQAAGTAMRWAHAHGRQTVSVVSLPDLCLRISGKPYYWSTDGVNSAFIFPHNAYDLQKVFSDKYADYVITEVMGDKTRNMAAPYYSFFTDNLC